MVKKPIREKAKKFSGPKQREKQELKNTRANRKNNGQEIVTRRMYVFKDSEHISHGFLLVDYALCFPCD